jgi:putative membrane protein
LNYRPLRLALTPGGTKCRRVRRRAVELFRSGCEIRPSGRTGVLIYLSLEERRAEIVADRAIVEKVEPDIWGEAMAVLVDEVKQGRPGQGMVLAVEKVGAVLASILPPKPHNPDELPNRLIVL